MNFPVNFAVGESRESTPTLHICTLCRFAIDVGFCKYGCPEDGVMVDSRDPDKVRVLVFRVTETLIEERPYKP